MTHKNTPHVAIIGAGLSGLSAGYALQKKGIRCTIYEARSTPGGVVQTNKTDGWLTEAGPNTMLVRDRRVQQLLEELNLEDDLQKTGPEAKKRYVLRDGRLVPVPTSLPGFLRTSLFSTKAKCRLLKEPFISTFAGDDESIAHFIKRRLGREVLDYAVNPFVSGVYAGDPQALSIRHTFSQLWQAEQQYGSILWGLARREKSPHAVKRRLCSFKRGLQQLPEALAHALKNAPSSSLQLNHAVTSITNEPDGWNLRYKDLHGKEQESHHSHLISTVPLHKLPSIWPNSATQNQLQQLQQVAYAPMSVLHLGFQREQISHPLDGFGLLVPEVEQKNLLGCLFSSTLFEGRSPDNQALLTCFMGGARNPALAAKTTQVLVKQALEELRPLLGVSGRPVMQRHTFWPRAIPQYKLGFSQRLDAMQQLEAHHPGLYVLGNFRGGVSVPDCMLNGLQLAAKLEKRL